MGVYDEINVKITGQVPEETGEIVVAELNLIAKRYGLEIEGGSR